MNAKSTAELWALITFLRGFAGQLPAALRAAPRRIERRGLSVREFTCLLPLSAGTKDDHSLGWQLAKMDARLSADLKNAQASSSFAGVPGLHSARLLLLGDTEKTGLRKTPRDQDRQSVVDGEKSAGGPLVLNLVYDGSLRDLLSRLLGKDSELRSVLAACDDFPVGKSTREVIAWLMKARVKGGYFFSDIADQSVEEITGAAKLWRAFQAFYAQHQGQASTHELRAAFRTFWSEQKQPTPSLSPFLEQRIRNEERWSRRVAEILRRAHVETIGTRTDQGQAAQRALHAKHHGCVEATFTVLPVDRRYQHGIFSKPAAYRALVRLSNSSPVPRADSSPDGRGMAIKVLGVEGTFATPEPLRQGIPQLEGQRTHDFVLINHRSFFMSDVEDAAVLLSALTAGGDVVGPALAVHFARRPRALYVLARTFFQRVNHPLDLTYHSSTAYLLGDLDDETTPAVKYSVRPKHRPGQKTFCYQPPSRKHPNFLAQQLAETLHPNHGEDVELELCLHTSKLDRPPVEDALARWRDAAVIPVATIRIKRQDFASAEAVERGERLEFNPWNARAENRPLGSINRARLLAYEQSTARRRPSVEQAAGARPERAVRHLVRLLAPV